MKRSLPIIGTFIFCVSAIFCLFLPDLVQRLFAAPASLEWQIFTNSDYNYQVSLPAKTEIKFENGKAAYTISDPSGSLGSWPWVVVEHYDHPVYHPPLDSDLQEWVLQHGFSFDTNLGYVEFNGLQTVGFINAGNSKKYSAEHYFFVRNGQLFHITIYHTEQKEDRKVEETFLNSFTFN